MPVNLSDFPIGCPECRNALAGLDDALMAVRNDPMVAACLHGFRDDVKLAHPEVSLSKRLNNGVFDDLKDTACRRLMVLTEIAGRSWHGKSEIAVSVADIAGLEDAMRDLSVRLHRILDMIDGRAASMRLEADEDAFFDCADNYCMQRPDLPSASDAVTFAGGVLVRSMLVGADGRCNHGLDPYVVRAYEICRDEMLADTASFSDVNGDLYSADGSEAYILSDVAGHPGKIVRDGFYRFLVGMDEWKFAGGAFENAMAKAVIL